MLKNPIEPAELLEYVKEYIEAANEAEDAPVALSEKLALYTLSHTTDRLYDFFTYRAINMHERGEIYSDGELECTLTGIKQVFNILFGTDTTDKV